MHKYINDENTSLIIGAVVLGIFFFFPVTDFAFQKPMTWISLGFSVFFIAFALKMFYNQEKEREKVYAELDYLIKKLKELKIPLPPDIKVNTFCQIPTKLIKEAEKNSFSQKSITQIYNFLSSYLDLKNVPELFIYNENRYNHENTKDYDHLKSDDSESGAYCYREDNEKRIFLIINKRFNINHILAILAHELTHDFLVSRGIILEDRHTNEIFTEITACYLGFGKLLERGYEKITWETSTLTETIKHRTRIGYLKPYAVKFIVETLSDHNYA